MKRREPLYEIGDRVATRWGMRMILARKWSRRSGWWYEVEGLEGRRWLYREADLG